MNLNSLSAISPIDGRYRKQTEGLAVFFSEFGLIQYRIKIEIEYFIFLNQLNLKGFNDVLTQEQVLNLRNVYLNFSEKEALEIKDIEKTTNHDVKAVEYFIKEKLKDLSLENFTEWVHFGLTSQDINNTSVPMSLKDGIETVILPEIHLLLTELKTMCDNFKNIPMLSKTHGQPASPTYLGKELMVFWERISLQVNDIKNIPYAAKFGGATGNFNAHTIAFPEINWHEKGKEFVENILGLKRSYPTTQIEHYDYLAALFDNIKRINTILIDFSRDIWQYISMEYFKQKLKEGEIGSSAMPHKVNPIDFENAEGNLGIANAIFEHLSAKLPISRLQRDLTDSTVLRNVGVPLSHTLISLKSIRKGMSKLLINENAIKNDLDNNWAVVAEAIQTVLRSIGYPQPYEALKSLTRKNEAITQQTITEFINQLEIDDEIKNRLLSITPHNFTGQF